MVLLNYIIRIKYMDFFNLRGILDYIDSIKIVYINIWIIDELRNIL